MTKIVSKPKPKEIFLAKKAIFIYLILLAIRMIYLMLFKVKVYSIAHSKDPSSININSLIIIDSLTNVVFYLLIVYMFWRIMRGSSVARIVFLIVFTLDLIANFFLHFTEMGKIFQSGYLNNILGIAENISLIFITILLFLPNSNAWFKNKKSVVSNQSDL